MGERDVERQGGGEGVRKSIFQHEHNALPKWQSGRTEHPTYTTYGNLICKPAAPVACGNGAAETEPERMESNRVNRGAISPEDSRASQKAARSFSGKEGIAEVSERMAG